MASPRWLIPATIILTLTPAGAASAAPSWSASAAPGTAQTQTSVAYDGSGNATAAWVQTDASGTSIWTARRDAGASLFGTATRLTAPVASGDTAVADKPQLAVDGAGDAIVAWSAERPTSAMDTITVATRSGATGTWSAPQIVSDSTLDSLDPSVAFSASGSALVAYDQSPSSGYTVGKVASVATSTVAVAAVQTITNSSAAVTDLRLASNSKGAVELVWTETSISFSAPYTGKSVLEGSYRAPGATTFPTPSLIYSSSPNAYAVSDSEVVLDESGTAGVAWSTINTNDDSLLAAAVATKATSASAFAGIYLTKTGGSQPRIATSTQGGFVAAYVQGATDGSATDIGTVRTARRGPGATNWAAATDLSGAVSTEPTLAAGPQGTTVASWITRPGTGDTAQAAVLPAGASSFLTPQNLDAAGGTLDQPGAAVDPSGNALLVWGRSGTTSHAASLDGSTVPAASTTPTPTPTPSPTPTPTPSPTPSQDSTPTPSPTPTPDGGSSTTTPAATPTPTPTPDPSSPSDPGTTTSTPGTTTGSGSGSTGGAGSTSTDGSVTATTPSKVTTPKLPTPVATGSAASTAAAASAHASSAVQASSAAGAVSATTAASGPAPSLRSFKAISPRRFHAATSGASLGTAGAGLRLNFTTNVAGTLRLVVTAVPPHGKAKNLKPFLSAPLQAGTTPLVFTGRVGDKPLAAGRYRLKAAFFDASGRLSNLRVMTIAISR